MYLDEDNEALPVNLNLQDSVPNIGAATLTSISAADAPGVDAARPTFTSSLTAVNTLVLTFNEPVHTTQTGGQGWLITNPAVTISGATDPNNGTSIIFTVATASGLDNNTSATPIITYSDNIAGQVTDLAGNEIAEDTRATSTDAASPIILDINLDNANTDVLVVTVSEPVTASTGTPPPATDFVLNNAAGSVTVNRVISSASQNRIMLGLSGTLTLADPSTTTLSYTRSAAGSFMDASNNALNNFATVTVNEVDTVPPTFTAQRTGLNTLVLTFNEPVDTACKPMDKAGHYPELPVLLLPPSPQTPILTTVPS